MRFMVIVNASKESEAGVLPDEKILTEMGKFNEELVKAGVLLAGDGLHPSSKGARVRFDGAKRTVIDGPFTETKELVSRKVEQRELGRIVQVPEVGRFHHRYEMRCAISTDFRRHSRRHRSSPFILGALLTSDFVGDQYSRSTGV